jgi:hypothetical protein
MAAAFVAAVMSLSAIAQTQTTTVFGGLANFDVYNDTGEDTHGFQIELDGIDASMISGTFPDSRYGAPTIIPFPGGIYVRYASTWDPAAQQFAVATTAPAAFTPTLGHSCILTSIVGCDHYGVALAASATNTVMQWLIADLANPGSLILFGGAPVPIPIPVVTVLPPVQANAAPIVAFDIKIPEVHPIQQFGEARWVKVLKTELPREVALDELLGNNPVVPNDPSLVETPWKLLQSNSRSASSAVLHSQGALGNGSHSVIRRYEFYKYTGVLDPATHEALCAAPECSAPAANELGDYIGDQMAAANVGVPSVTVTKSGTGTVLGANGKINCGGSCTTSVVAGSTVSLTANPGGSLFSGWGGACNGADLSCSLVVNNALNVTATFTPIHTLSVGRGGNGTVTGNPAGLQSTQINCGGSCSAKFAEGTVVTLMAAPPAGLKFVSWSGACSGAVPTCSVIISKDTQVQANFK